MKKTLEISFIVIVGLLVMACNSSEANNSTSHSNDVEQLVDWLSMEEAQERAREEGKWVLIDVYTEWCGFCRRMNTETYRDENVLKAIEENYLAVRLDAESKDVITFNGHQIEKRDLAYEFRVSSYPTTIIIAHDGEPFAAQPGFMDAPTFTNILNFVADGKYETMSFEEYEKSLAQ